MEELVENLSSDDKKSSNTLHPFEIHPHREHNANR